MKKTILIFIITLSVIGLDAQVLSTPNETSAVTKPSNFDITLSKPFSIGKNMTHHFYNAIVDLDFGYHFITESKYKFGLGFNTTYFRSNQESIFRATVLGSSDTVTYSINKAESFIFNPKITFTYDLSTRFSMTSAIGYAIQRTHYTLPDQVIEGITLLPPVKASGPSLDLGLRYDLNKAVYLQAQYTGISFYRSAYYQYQSGGLSGNNKSAQNIKLGLGYSF